MYKNWIINISVGIMIINIIMLFLPSQKYKESLDLITGLFLLMCFVSPLFLNTDFIKLDYSLVEEERNNISSSIEEKINLDLKNKVMTAIVEILNRNNIQVMADDVYFECGDIKNSRIIISKKYEYEKEKINELLSDYFGFEINIEYINKEGDDYK